MFSFNNRKFHITNSGVCSNICSIFCEGLPIFCNICFSFRNEFNIIYIYICLTIIHIYYKIGEHRSNSKVFQFRQFSIFIQVYRIILSIYCFFETKMCNILKITMETSFCAGRSLYHKIFIYIV